MTWIGILVILALCAIVGFINGKDSQRKASPAQHISEGASDANGGAMPEKANTPDAIDNSASDLGGEANHGKVANEAVNGQGGERPAAAPGATADPKPMARQVFIDTLVKIGCQYEIGDDGRILFAYQGERFVAGATNEHAYVFIWDYCWSSVDLHDIDEVARLRKSINKANIDCSIKTVFTIDNENNSMDVHCQSVLLFIPQIPDLCGYLRLELNEFFRAHQAVGQEMSKLRDKEHAEEMKKAN